MPIVWQKPDGSLLVTQLTDGFLERGRMPDESTATAVSRLAEGIRAQNPALRDCAKVLIKTVDMPNDRLRRHAWRLVAGSVVVDPSVPDPVHPKQQLLDMIASAQTFDQLKSVLITVVKGG